MATVGGLLVGVLATGLVFPWFASFYASTPFGAFTLPQLVQLPYGVVVAAIVVMAVAIFGLAERLERRT